MISRGASRVVAIWEVKNIFIDFKVTLTVMTDNIFEEVFRKGLLAEFLKNSYLKSLQMVIAAMKLKDAYSLEEKL